MDHIIVIGTTIIICGIYNYIKNKYYSEEEEEAIDVQEIQEAQDEPNFEKVFNVEHELLNVLREMNCTPECKDEGDKRILSFTFQGENFFILLNKGDNRKANIIDPYWFGANQEDIHLLSEIRKAVNEVNKLMYGTTLYYTFNDGNINVSSIDNIIVSNIKEETKLSLETAINGFFVAHREFEKELLRNNIEI